MKKSWAKLVLVISLIFAYTLWLRLPFYNTLSDWHNQWLTGSTIKFTTNWYREGMVNLKFAMLETPLSIETPSIQLRNPYPSYPPGTIVPIYILSKVFNYSPDVKLVQIYNYFNHWIISVLLCYLAWNLLSHLSTKLRFFLSLLAPLTYLLMPGPLYWHQTVYFSDQAVILPFILALVLEFKLDKTKKCKYFWLQYIVHFIGLMTDWFYYVFIGVLFIKRIINKQSIKQIFSLVLIGIICLSIFFYQLHVLDILPALKQKLLIRTGISGEENELVKKFFSKWWLGHVAKQFGYIGPWFLLISYYLFIPLFLFGMIKKIMSDKSKELANYIFLISIPCLLQVYLLMNHSVVHDFSVLKFTVVLALIPFILLPQFLRFMTWDLKKVFPKYLFIPSTKFYRYLFIIFFLNLIYIHPRWHKMYVQPTTNFHVEAKYIREQATYNDIYFSPNFLIQENPPQKMSFSMKRVYKADTLYQMFQKIDEINNEHINVTLIILPINRCHIFQEDILKLLSPTDHVSFDDKKAAFIHLGQETIKNLKKNNNLINKPMCLDKEDIQFI